MKHPEEYPHTEAEVRAIIEERDKLKLQVRDLQQALTEHHWWSNCICELKRCLLPEPKKCTCFDGEVSLSCRIHGSNGICFVSLMGYAGRERCGLPLPCRLHDRKVDPEDAQRGPS